MFTLHVYQPLQRGQPLALVSTRDINPDITAVAFTTGDPGGFVDLEIGMQTFMTGGSGGEIGRLPEPLWLPPFAHVVLKDGKFLAWEGRVMGVDRNDGGHVTGFYAQGYGVTATQDQYVISKALTKRTSGALLQEAILSKAPLLVIDPATFVDPGVYHTSSEFDALYPSDIINAFVREGGAVFSAANTSSGGVGADASSGVWSFLVYEDRRVIFQPRLPPAGTLDDPFDWWMPFDSRVQWHEDYTTYIGAVQVRYKDLSKGGQTNLTPIVVNAQFQGDNGFLRMQLLEGGAMNPEAALALAQSYLANRSNITYAVKVTLAQLQSVQRWLTGSDGLPPWHVRAGDWLQIGDQPAVPIIHTQCDTMAETMLIEAGEPLPSGSHLMRTLRRVSTSVIKLVNPTSGARN